MNEIQPERVTEYPEGVVCIDTGFVRPAMAASYLVEAGDEAAFIETGTNRNVTALLEVLERRGWRREQLRYVIVTHAHLDHAGGAGSLMQQLPRATLLAHPRAAPHLVNPARLEAGVRAVYGDSFYDAMYGMLVPVDSARVRIMEEGDTMKLGDRTLHFVDTPGHARHHFCVFDDRSRGWFSGDTFGVSYRELDTHAGAFIFPSTTPTELDPPALRHSIGRLMEWSPQCMFLVHFGRVQSLERLRKDLLNRLERMVDVAERHANSVRRAEAIRSELLDQLMVEARAHGVNMDDARLIELLDNDVTLNAHGLVAWLNRVAKA